jgi:hypothetical protein
MFAHILGRANDQRVGLRFAAFQKSQGRKRSVAHAVMLLTPRCPGAVGRLVPSKEDYTNIDGGIDPFLKRTW